MSSAQGGYEPQYPPYEGDAAAWRRFFRSPLKMAAVFLVFALPTSCLGLGAAERGWQEESHAYARAVLPRVAQPWSTAAVKAESTRELRSMVPDAKLDEYVASFGRRLGSLQEIRSVTGVCSFTVATGGFSVWARYDVQVQFEKAAGVAKLSLVKREGRWWIAGLYVESDALVP